MKEFCLKYDRKLLIFLMLVSESKALTKNMHSYICTRYVGHTYFIQFVATWKRISKMMSSKL